jgi:hypothetical protein
MTNYGELKGITSALTYPNGALKSCMVNEENCLQTLVGELVPQYSSPEFGERQKKHRSSIDFFENGQIKSAALDRQTLIETPMGPIKAELVTFYADGSINRIFPLNGLIDGYWSEANERDIAEVLQLDSPVGQICAKIIGIHFYPSGALKSLTVWPGQVLNLITPLGQIRCRAGFSLYENGHVRSIEPASIVELPTPVGVIKAFDPEIIGMHADNNSVQFTETGMLTAVTTIHTGIKVTTSAGDEYNIQPYETASNIDPSQLCTVPMKIVFTADSVHIQARESWTYKFSECQFATYAYERAVQVSCKDCPEDETCCKNGGEGVGGSGGCCGGGGCG